jgi:regulatory protein
LLNEERFASEYARMRAGRGYGPQRILQELRERGISEPEARDALDFLEQDWWAAAADIRQRKFGAALPSELADIAKQQRFLQYRGFSAEQARAAVQPR